MRYKDLDMDMAGTFNYEVKTADIKKVKVKVKLMRYYMM